MKYDMPSCGGCRTCEIACSYHHTGKFAPSVSSLKVLDKKMGEGFIIELLEKSKNNRYKCDGCEGLKEPLCIEWCKQKDDLRNFLDNFLKKKISNK